MSPIYANWKDDSRVCTEDRCDFLITETVRNSSAHLQIVLCEEVNILGIFNILGKHFVLKY